MEATEFIMQRVHHYYWEDDLNCACTVLKTLAELFGIGLNAQVIHGAVGMHGAGGYGAQCGLVEGSLMFIGIWGHSIGLDEAVIIKKCHDFARDFEKTFRSLNCGILRPAGFKPDNPPHLCEELTVKALVFTCNYLRDGDRDCRAKDG